MKPLLLLPFFISLYLSVSSQEITRQTCLVVTLLKDFDRSTSTEFYKINAEKGNPHAKEVYDLLAYHTGKNAVNKDAVRFFERKTDSGNYYNYFNNVTEMLMFMSEKDWELVTVTERIYSIRKYGSDYEFKSEPVYYLRKTVK